MVKKHFFQIHWKAFLLFSTAFIVFTPLGTVSHEFGHVIAAQIRGYETKLHFASMDWNADAAKKQLEVLYLENEEDILSSQPFPDKPKMEKIAGKLKNDSLFITSAGPIQTILTGIIGLVLLFSRRRAISQKGLQPLDWLSVFLSLFWLREIFNLCNSVSKKLLGTAESYFGGDEAQISVMLGLAPGVIPLICGFMGLCVLAYVLKAIPSQKRLTLLLGGLTGGTIGFCIWLKLLGPAILP